MSKTIKNIVLVFTLICAVALVVFCVELFLINRDDAEPAVPDQGAAAPNGGPGETQNGNGPALNGGGSQQNGEENGEQISSGPPDNPGRQDNPQQPSEGEQYNLPISNVSRVDLVLFADEELFDYEEFEGFSWQFTYSGDDSAALEIAFAFIRPQDEEGYISAFLYNYLDGGESTAPVERNVGNSLIEGMFITGINAGTTYEAWIRSLSDMGEENMLLVFVVKYQNEAQKLAIYNILDSMLFALRDEVDDE